MTRRCVAHVAMIIGLCHDRRHLGAADATFIRYLGVTVKKLSGINATIAALRVAPAATAARSM